MMSEDDLIRKITESMQTDEFRNEELDINSDDVSEKLEAMWGTIKEVNDFLRQYFMQEMLARPFELKTMLAGQSAMLLGTIAESYFKMVKKIIEKGDIKGNGEQD